MTHTACTASRTARRHARRSRPATASSTSCSARSAWCVLQTGPSKNGLDALRRRPIRKKTRELIWRTAQVDTNAQRVVCLEGLGVLIAELHLGAVQSGHLRLSLQDKSHRNCS